MLKKLIVCQLLTLSILVQYATAQKAVPLNGAINQHIFTATEIAVLQDESEKLTISDIQKADSEHRFKTNTEYYPRSLPNVASWYKIKLRLDTGLKDGQSVIEFFDQTTHDIIAYLPDATGHYIQSRSGANFKFNDRLYQHKNFEFAFQRVPKGEYTCYFRVKAKTKVNIIIVYRTVNFFIHYALNEYFSYGLFYGIILIFSLHNLLMYMAVKKRQYLYYVLYVLSVGLFEMSTDGIAYQYIWPNASDWNQYAYGFALYSLSFFALVFTKELLHVRTLTPKLHKLINGLIIVRTVYFIYCAFFNKDLFYYKFIDFAPLSIAFATGVIVWAKGFKPARFFVLGYTFLIIAFIVKAISVLGFARILPGVFVNYSLSMGFVLEMVFLSFSIGDQVRILRKDKEEAQDEIIHQMALNSELQESINKELEIKVDERTKEVVEKSKEILGQARVIEDQNEELISINKQLELQAAEISRMNVLLEKDNIQLKSNIEKVTDARVLSTELSFEEFSAKYPDQENCNKFLANIKWANGFSCIKCGSTDYKHGRAPHSRRCTKCNYEESVLYNTIFQNNRIPINKAFYLVYLMYTTKGTISSYQLSEKLGIRQSTCWNYAIRVKKVMDERRFKSKRNNQQGWNMLILDQPSTSTARAI